MTRSFVNLMRIVFLMAFALTAAFEATAEPQWQLVGSLPGSPSRGVIVPIANQLWGPTGIASSDGGKNWAPAKVIALNGKQSQLAVAPFSIGDTEYAKAQIALKPAPNMVEFGFQYLVRSSDGGITWNMPQSQPCTMPFSISYLGAAQGTLFAVCSSVLNQAIFSEVSDDAGATWRRVAGPKAVYAFATVGDGIILFGGPPGQGPVILKVGATSWQPAWLQSGQPFAFVSSCGSHTIAQAPEGAVGYIDISGSPSTWRLIQLPTLSQRILPVGIMACDDQTFFLDAGGSMFLSEDNGIKWRFISREGVSVPPSLGGEDQIGIIGDSLILVSSGKVFTRPIR